MLSRLTRFNVVAAGRRSGKTEILGKRLVVLRAMFAHCRDSPFYVPYDDVYMAVCAPTREQAKRLYWRDLKALIPRNLVVGKPNESSLTITLQNGVTIYVLGLDKPQRAEGTPWSHIGLDEYGSMKPETWTQHIRPSLSDRHGTCDFYGVPEGRNHFYKLWKKVQAYEVQCERDGIAPVWRHFHWKAAEVLDPTEIQQAREDMDDLSFQQEYEASFVSFTGRAYYPFDATKHCHALRYNPEGILALCFDFNVEPGVAVVAQEQELPNRQLGTGCIGEVYIPRGSNTPMVCNRLIQDWGKHRGPVVCYGDSTGQAQGSAKVLGSDWQIIKQLLWRHFGSRRVVFRVPRTNPKERDRVNAVNTRLETLSGKVQLMVDPSKCPNLVEDLENVTLVKGGSGELDKTIDLTRTHPTDALGYYINREFPLKPQYVTAGAKFWK